MRAGLDHAKQHRDSAAGLRQLLRELQPGVRQAFPASHHPRDAARRNEDFSVNLLNNDEFRGEVARAMPSRVPAGRSGRTPGILTSLQRTTLALIEKTNKPLYRAYLLKEQLRLVFQLPFAKAVKALDRWLSWARRCRLQPFVRLARSVAYYRDDIEAALRHRLSNALVESTNTKIRLITRRSFGFYSPAPLIALAMLSLGGLMPTPARPWIPPTDMAVEPEILSHSVLPDFLGMVLRCSN